MLAIDQHCWYQISLILDWIPGERDSKTEMWLEEVYRGELFERTPVGEGGKQITEESEKQCEWRPPVILQWSFESVMVLQSCPESGLGAQAFVPTNRQSVDTGCAREGGSMTWRKTAFLAEG